MIVELPFETPSKKNSRIVNRRTGRSFPSKAYSGWHDKAAMWIRCKYPIRTVEGPVEVRIAFTHGTRQRCDSDNKASSIFDLLVDLGIIKDDEWKVVQRFSVENSYEKGKPSCRIEIEEIR